MNEHILDQPDSDKRPTFAKKAHQKMKLLGYLFIALLTLLYIVSRGNLFYIDLMTIPISIVLIVMLILSILGFRDCIKSYRRKEVANFWRGLSLGVFILSLLIFALTFFANLIDIYRAFLR